VIWLGIGLTVVAILHHLRLSRLERVVEELKKEA
jgi:hypothetical protein